eukprot:366240-Chlamydomonas_euryale.AAC.11
MCARSWSIVGSRTPPSRSALRRPPRLPTRIPAGGARLPLPLPLPRAPTGALAAVFAVALVSEPQMSALGRCRSASASSNASTAARSSNRSREMRLESAARAAGLVVAPPLRRTRCTSVARFWQAGVHASGQMVSVECVDVCGHTALTQHECVDV